MKRTSLIVMAIMLGISVTVASARQTHHKKRHHHRISLICPVTGDKIASVNAAVGHTVYHGKTYYFCCAECKPRFDKNPATYVRNAAKGKYEKM